MSTPWTKENQNNPLSAQKKNVERKKKKKVILDDGN